MSGQAKTAMPTAIPSRPENASQPRAPLPAVNELASETIPLARVYAPHRIMSAYRLMPGQTKSTTPKATESAPFRPSAHLIFVSCVLAIFVTRSNVDSILGTSRCLRGDDRTLDRTRRRRIGDRTERVREITQDDLPRAARARPSRRR